MGLIRLAYLELLMWLVTVSIRAKPIYVGKFWIFEILLPLNKVEEVFV